MYAEWQKLLRALNFYLEQEFTYFMVDSPLQRAKIEIMDRVLSLIKSLLDCRTKQELNGLMVKVNQQVNLQNLKCKLLDIFKFKVAGTPHKEHVYMTNRQCKHYTQSSGSKASKRKAFCQEGEYCFFEHLLPLDFVTINCAFNIFFLLMYANEVMPSDTIGSIKFDPEQNSWSFEKNWSRFKPQIHFESFERIKEVV